ncbi:MAG: alkene reductase [Hellea sp.]|nr:alkene reductase [Hellea sp.]
MSKTNALLTACKLGDIDIANRVVMAPMTRNRADADGTPNSLMRDHYSQRASAGLIVAEGTWPVAAGQAYNRQPGIETPKHIQGWRAVTDAVHQQGGKIVLQVMHAGRIGSHHIKGSEVATVAPSAIKARGEVHTDSAGMQPYDMPTELSTEEVWQVIDEHRQAAKNALEAGFDGVELHCTSGYLPAQFLSTGTNHRRDIYGGSLSNRLRFTTEVLEGLIKIFGAGRVGLRICPGNPFNDLKDCNPEETFRELIAKANLLKIGYLHVIRMKAGVDNVKLASEFQGDIILNDSYNLERGNRALKNKEADAISFGRAFIANPKLVESFKGNMELFLPDFKTLYTPGPKGYIDYT